MAVTLLPELTSRLGVPRSVHVAGEFGSPMGPPGDVGTQERTLMACLEAAAELGPGEIIDL